MLPIYQLNDCVISYLHKERFKLKDVILDVMTNMKNQIVNNEVELSWYKSTQDIFAKADKERIIQVISNLLNNAIKFTEAGTIFISTKIKGNKKKEVLVSIKILVKVYTRIHCLGYFRNLRQNHSKAQD
jgi:signal transduction histidine kinase